MNDGEVRRIVRENLIQCRREKGLTQTEVGDLVGKTKTAVASWEQGKSLPDADTLSRLAKYYGKTMAYMYGEEDTLEAHDDSANKYKWLQLFGQSPEPPKETKQLLEDFAKLTRDQQLTVLALIHSMTPNKEKP